MSRRFVLAAALMSFGTGAVAFADEGRPGRPQPGDIAPNINLAPASYSIDVEEHLGNTLDRGVPFVDHNGKPVDIGQFFDGINERSTDDELLAVAAGFPVFRILPAP